MTAQPIDFTARARNLMRRWRWNLNRSDIELWAEEFASIATQARQEGIEEAAKVVDQCNREGPYNAIGAASRIRALSETGPLISDAVHAELMRVQFGDALSSTPTSKPSVGETPAGYGDFDGHAIEAAIDSYVADRAAATPSPATPETT